MKITAKQFVMDNHEMTEESELDRVSFTGHSLIDMFEAGQEVLLDQAREGFGSYYYDSEIYKYHEDAAKAAWQAAKLSSMKEIEELKTAMLEIVESLGNWIEWEKNQVQKEGKYCGDEINFLIDCGNATLSKHAELIKRLKGESK